MRTTLWSRAVEPTSATASSRCPTRTTGKSPLLLPRGWLLYRRSVADTDELLPRSWHIGVALSLCVMLLAGGIVIYRTTQPCWPWEETTSMTGGTFCDGEPARITTD